jgi:hypothetical protein
MISPWRQYSEVKAAFKGVKGVKDDFGGGEGPACGAFPTADRVKLTFRHMNPASVRV